MLYCSNCTDPLHESELKHRCKKCDKPLCSHCNRKVYWCEACREEWVKNNPAKEYDQFR